ncbi:MAG: ribosome small subunit-dependent GTPase A [Clostridiales bacterium]|nr:ribosome small subunit-dependent GTPase A [Clostridiales bacterium]
MTGVIVRSLSGFYDVDVQGQVLRCRGRGKLRHQKQKPLVGDRAEITPLSEQEGVLDAILPRRNALERPAVANMDQILIVASGAIPVTDPFLIDRITALAIAVDCQPVILFNKWDLVPVPELAEIYANAGFTVIPCSARTGQGVEEIRSCLRDRISVFTGNSGVGKSSLLNALEGSLELATGEVSAKLGRGRHTTRMVELFRLPGNALAADTPGFAAFDPQTPELMDAQALAGYFPEFRPYLYDCSFADCAHVKEKGCGLLEAIKQGKVSKSRHDSYVRLYQQAKEYRPWENHGKNGPS